MMNLPIAIRCGECKHWTQEPLQDYKNAYGWDEDSLPVDLTTGVCTLALHVEKANVKEDQPATGFTGPMMVKDASSFHAALWTKDTHGCLAGVQKGINEGNTTTPVERNHLV